jgi:hypothetical protein
MTDSRRTLRNTTDQLSVVSETLSNILSDALGGMARITVESIEPSPGSRYIKASAKVRIDFYTDQAIAEKVLEKDR